MFHLSPLAKNRKLGLGVAVSTSHNGTCPDSCPLKSNGCYANNGPLSRHWNAVNNGSRGFEWEDFILNVSALPKKWKFRHNQAGDLPGDNEKIDSKKLNELSTVVQKRELIAWIYTHKPLNKKNLNAIQKAISKGFVINASADNLREADSFKEKGVPVVVVLPKDSPHTVFTPKGNKVVVCPAQRFEKSDCSNCLLCHKKDRSVIVGFRAHGSGRNKATEVSKGEKKKRKNL